MIHENLVFSSKYACYSSESKGRVYAENPSKTRTEFQRDHDRIIHSTSLSEDWSTKPRCLLTMKAIYSALVLRTLSR